MNRIARSSALALGIALVLHGAPAFAQGKGMSYGGNQPQPPKPEEVTKATLEILAGADAKTTELAGLAKITYKAVPSFDDVMKKLADRFKPQLPKDSSEVMQQYSPNITEGFEKFLSDGDGCKFEALADLKFKSSKLPKGEYHLSVLTDGSALKQLILTQGKQGEKGYVEVKVSFDSGKKAKDSFGVFKLELKTFEKKGDKDTFQKFDVESELFRSSQKTSEPFKAPDVKKDDSGSSGGSDKK